MGAISHFGYNEKDARKKTLCIWGGCGCEWGVHCGSLVREHRMGGEACAESRELLSPGEY
jgi:hypothetical protein